MNDETLDALLIDRALGELAPEVDALLAAYLAHEPDHAARAQRLAGTIELARVAAAADATAPRRPTKLPKWRAPRAAVGAFRRVELIRLAACLALGVAAGWMADAQWSARKQPAARPIAAAAPGLKGAHDREGTEFWSVNALTRGQALRPAIDRAPYRLRWESPGKQPSLEENQ